MASKKRTAKLDAGDSQINASVVDFLKKLEHPLKKEIATVRKIILGISPDIHEGVKWNAPSFRTTEFFATFFLRDRDCVKLIFHLGAKVKDNSTKGIQIPDPNRMIEWLAKERCLVTVGAGKDIQANRTALEAIVRKWIKQL